MRLFWNTIIGPVFEILRPETIVEIGSASGGNTRNVLEYCRRSGAKLHVVDPFHDALRPSACLLICAEVAKRDGRIVSWTTHFQEKPQTGAKEDV